MHRADTHGGGSQSKTYGQAAAIAAGDGHGIARVFSNHQISEILGFIDNNTITENTMEEMARKLGTAAFKFFNTERNSKPRLTFDSFLFRKILDAWYNDMGSKSERDEALDKFIEIALLSKDKVS